MKKGFAPVILISIGIVSGVIILSFFGWWYGKYKTAGPFPPIAPKNNSLTSPSPAASSNETANWKTYTSKTTNVSFKLPQDWTIEEDRRPLPNGMPDQTEIVLKGPNNFGITYYENFFGGFSGTKLKYSENIDLAGIKATKEYMIGFDDPTESVPVQMFVNLEPDKSLPQDNPKFLTASFERDTFEEENKILDQILSTFRFTE